MQSWSAPKHGRWSGRTPHHRSSGPPPSSARHPPFPYPVTEATKTPVGDEARVMAIPAPQRHSLLHQSVSPSYYLGLLGIRGGRLLLVPTGRRRGVVRVRMRPVPVHHGVVVLGRHAASMGEKVHNVPTNSAKAREGAARGRVGCTHCLGWSKRQLMPYEHIPVNTHQQTEVAPVSV